MSDSARLPPGEYAFVELFGHTTLVGRIAEVERFGTKMMAIEPVFRDELLPAVFHGGAAIYRFTPCTPDAARAHQPTSEWQLPAPIRSIIPAALLEAPPTVKIEADEDEDEDEDEDQGEGADSGTEDPPLTPQQIGLARHALGLENGQTSSYRNRYLAAAGGDTEAAWNGMVECGLAERGAATGLGVWFSLTEAGARRVLLPGESLDREDFPGAAK